VACRRKALNLKGSSAATKSLSEISKWQLVLDQLDKDPSRHQGPSLIKEAILAETVINLMRCVYYCKCVAGVL
jgi:hypothetical protein